MYSAGAGKNAVGKKRLSLYPKAKLPMSKVEPATNPATEKLHSFGRMEDLFGRDRLSEALREKRSMDGFDVVRSGAGRGFCSHLINEGMIDAGYRALTVGCLRSLAFDFSS
jgi:hypothetical protein